MELSEITVFVKVVQMGSFGKAAQALGLSKSTISAKINQLEERLKTSLIRRTTRQLHPTPAGEAYFHDCVKALEILTASEARVSKDHEGDEGVLRVTVPAGLAESWVPKILMDYSRRCPKVEVEVVITNRLVDLVGEGIDLAIRAGVNLKDSGLIARKVGSTEFGLFASPRYLNAHGSPRNPKSLSQHRWLKSTLIPDPITMTNGKGEKFQISRSGSLRADNLPLLKKMAVLGGGIALLDSLNAESDVESGKLIRVLPDWKAETHALYLVYPPHKYSSKKHRVFMDTVIASLKKA